MALTLSGLLYFQIMYLENMVKMRDAQFSENVRRSLYATSVFLEKEETMYFLEKDVRIIESSLFDNEYGNTGSDNISNVKYSIEGSDGTIRKYTLPSKNIHTENNGNHFKFPSPTQGIASRYQTLQEVIRGQYLYQRGLLNEVIISILRDSGSRPASERADSTLIRKYLTTELSNTGINLPFSFSLTDEKGSIIYYTPNYIPKEDTIYTQRLFPNSSERYYLNIIFPTKDTYIFSTVRFIIPTLALTIILLIVFVYTIITAFRQKKLIEMKNDFINNMTHEFKTPISTISLAAQMLNDDSVRKSPNMLQHLSQVITDESKRLRFQVEKVLQMSIFNKDQTRLKLSVVNVNSTIATVVHTFKIKAEKFGGCIDTYLNAVNAEVMVDEMHFTNVLFNLLDNAIKYMQEDVPPKLKVSTNDINDSFIEIRVSDNGIGIRKEDIKRIFEKFYRVNTGNRHDVKGFGLGLAYVKKMLEAFKGSIEVESELGIGTTFIITLPLTSNIEEEK